MAITYRPIASEEIDAFFLSNSYGFGRDFDPNSPWLEGMRTYGELDRSTAAFEGDTIVGTAGIYSFDLTVPGATVPTAGVTWVSVRPTHRRKGVLTGMMHWQMDHIRERGECLAALWASEAPIYGRFGYGLAAEGVEMTIERTRTELRHVAPFSGRTRFVTREEALAAWPAIYDCVRLKTPGMISRPPHWWTARHLSEFERPMAGYGKSFHVQYEEEGQPLGYVRYRIKEGYEAGSSTATVGVGELMAATDAAYAALWSYIFGVDLIETITTSWGSVDEPLQHMLADPRRLVRRPQDTLFVRLVDVPTALTARRYAAKDAIVIGVEDAFCPWNTGSYLLEGGPDGASCARSTAAPAISVSAETLGAVYLGGTRFAALARAGRIAGSDEAIRRADAMFAWHPRPWIPEIF